jgi:hypothetical protein
LDRTAPGRISLRASFAGTPLSAAVAASSASSAVATAPFSVSSAARLSFVGRRGWAVSAPGAALAATSAASAVLCLARPATLAGLSTTSTTVSSGTSSVAWLESEWVPWCSSAYLKVLYAPPC